MTYPKRPKSHKTDSKAVNIIRLMLESDWIIRTQDDRDYGIDIQLERFDGEVPTGDFIFAQIKGTEDEFDDQVKYAGFPVKTISYALLFQVPFFVFYTSVTSNKVKFVWLQKYAEKHLEVKSPNWRTQETLTIQFPKENELKPSVRKIIDIVNNERRIKVAHTYVMLYERFAQFHQKLKDGDAEAARVCYELFCRIIKINGLAEFGGDMMLGPDQRSKKAKVIMFLTIYQRLMRDPEITEEELEWLDNLDSSLKLGKLNAVNIELLDNIGHWINESTPY